MIYPATKQIRVKIDLILYNYLYPKIDYLPPPGHVVIDVSMEISEWIETTQPIHTWKNSISDAKFYYLDRFTVEEELAMMIALKWSPTK